MSEKVRLPKDVYDALDKVMNPPFNYISSRIITNTVNQSWGFEKNVLNTVSVELLMQALVLGYDPEMTAEELMKEVYFLPYAPEAIPNTMEEAFKEGVRAALDIHGIHYDWMDAE